MHKVLVTSRLTACNTDAGGLAFLLFPSARQRTFSAEMRLLLRASVEFIIDKRIKNLHIWIHIYIRQTVCQSGAHTIIVGIEICGVEVGVTDHVCIVRDA